MTAPAPVHVDMISDLVCPWCWLGLRHLDAALALRPERPATVAFRPFQLDPDIPAEGVPYRAYMAWKFGAPGGRRHWSAMRQHLEAAAEETGVVFRFDDIPMRPNTMNAHRLLRWAQGQGFGRAAKEALFKAFFVDLRDIGAPETLADLASNIGMDGSLVRALLATTQDAEAVRAEERQARDQGIQAVPTFVFDGRVAVAGAQEAKALVTAMDHAAKAIPYTD